MNEIEKIINNSIKKEKGLFLKIKDINEVFIDKLSLNIKTEFLEYSTKDWITIDGENKNIAHHFFSDILLCNYLIKIEDTNVYKELEDLIDVNFKYKNSKSYENFVSKMKSNNPQIKQHKKLDSYEEIDRYFIRFIELYNSIEKNGIKNHKYYKSDKENSAIGIAIDKDYNIYKLPGAQHRISIIKKLGIEKIPVQLRHININIFKSNKNIFLNLFPLNNLRTIKKIVKKIDKF